jgi:uncharacterized protein YyaL (SSP411 family)
MPNRLAREQSPYLLQHKDNPVDWYPWGEDAFARARGEDKPIFLSIGYSTCHWCHVMEHESFENPQVADVLNQHFVSIKVDREERPDVDRVYMTFVQATTGSGGWPMSVWLTPSLEPFYGGTYYPPTSRWGRPGFVEILTEVARVWREERAKVTQSAATIIGRLRSLGRSGAGAGTPGTELLDAAVQQFAGSFDASRGGFGDQPKFPRPSELLFLLREYYRTGNVRPRDMVLTTLSAMALGGMRDHIGGGFHRYSVDRDWRVPHFEKMLYDQAQLVLACVEAAQASGDRFFADMALDTLDYVRRDMTDPSGGFYSAEDADSIPPERANEPGAHKMEGAFYIWRDDEIGDALGADADVFRSRYGILPDGNAPFDPQNEFTHKNLLYTARSVDEVAAACGRTPEDVVAALARSRDTLLDVRARRPRPHLDDKVLTAWNGLMIAAFARAARMLAGAGEYLADAQRAATFIRTTLWDAGTRTLLRRYRQGESGIHGYAEDYAYLTFGLLELFQADGDPAWLEWAIALQRRQDELFWDNQEGGWFSTTGDDPSVLLRMKEEYDGAEPAASSVSVLNLLILAHLADSSVRLKPDPTDADGAVRLKPDATDANGGADANGGVRLQPDHHGPVDDFSRRLEDTLSTFGSRAAGLGRAVPLLLAGLSMYHAGLPQVVIAGDRSAVEPLMTVLRKHYLPTAITVPVTSRHRETLTRLLPWTGAMAGEGGPIAYVCHDFVCERPVETADDLNAAIKRIVNHES